MMCCGKMIRLPSKRTRLPDEKKRIILTTRNISVNLDKTGGLNDYNETNKRKFEQRKT